MRELKFRAWDKDLKRWCFSTEVTLEGSGQYIHHHYPKTGHQPNSVNEHQHMGGCPHIEAICLFTGLKDKNGVEIYEGDIIKFSSLNQKKPMILPVVWDDKACGFHCDNGQNQRGVDMAADYDTVSGEVIGNIYENKDLLS